MCSFSGCYMRDPNHSFDSEQYIEVPIHSKRYQMLGKIHYAKYMTVKIIGWLSVPDKLKSHVKLDDYYINSILLPSKMTTRIKLEL